MTAEPLTEAERATLLELRAEDASTGAVRSTFEAQTAELVAAGIAPYPDRVRQLVVLSSLAVAAAAARDAVLADIIDGEQGPMTLGDDGVRRGLALQPHRLPGLALASGLSTQTIRARARAMIRAKIGYDL